ncbi:hypothetical protein IKF89_02920 [Candidatus Saccharibacteria bacterium]|nr:hypothetical protein [Candidatus Saccharibacteria bacterium]
MNTALKRATVVLSVILMMAIVMLVSLVTAHYDGAYATSGEIDDLPKMVVSDVAYKPAVGVGITSKKATPENIAELEEAAAEAEAVAEDETDWQEESYECEDYEDCGDYGDGSYIVYVGDDYYIVNPNLAPYDGGGYYNANLNGAWHDGAEFYYTGGYLYKDDSGMGFTWYSENVLPGGGLNIPGRHIDEEGYVCDENGYICLASDNLLKGTVVSIPFGCGTGVVYDKGSGDGNIDVYVSW